MTLEQWLQKDETRRPTIWQQFESIEQELLAERASLKHKGFPPSMIAEDGLFLCDMIRAMKQEIDRHRQRPRVLAKSPKPTPEQRAEAAKRLDATIEKAMLAFRRLRPSD